MREDGIIRREDVKVGDVVQVTNAEKGGWFGALLTVSEVKTWGIQGYMHCVDDIAEPGSQAYLRVKWDDLEWVGVATVMFGSAAADPVEEATRDD